MADRLVVVRAGSFGVDKIELAEALVGMIELAVVGAERPEVEAGTLAFDLRAGMPGPDLDTPGAEADRSGTGTGHCTAVADLHFALDIERCMQIVACCRAVKPDRNLVMHRSWGFED